MASERLDIIIKARNEAAQTLNETDRMLSDIEQGAKDMATSLGIALGVKGTFELGQMAAGAKRLEASFRGLAGSGADKMLERLQQASRGTIAQTDLMLSANRAMMLGVTQDGETLARLLEIAAVRGQAMGLTTQQAFDDLVTGIGRASPLILDNLGIVTGGVAVYDAYAQSIGKTVDALSEQEKKQALTQMVLKQGEGMTFTEDEAASWEKMDAALKDLSVSLGDLLNETLKLPEAVSLAAAALEGFNDALEGGKGRQERVVVWSEAFEAALKRQVEAGQLSVVAYNAQRAALEALEKAAWAGVISEGAYLEQLYKLNPAAKLAAIEIYGTAVRTGEEAAAASAAVGPNNALAGSLDGVADAAANAQKELDALRSGTWQDWMADYASEIDAGLLEGSLSFAERLDAAAQSTTVRVENWLARRGTDEALQRTYGARAPSRSTGAADDARRQTEEMLRTIRSTVDSVFVATQPTERDWWETALGIYADKPDEYLRRLRSAITDVNSEWKHLLGGLEGDAARLFVAQQEELWRTGQWSQMGAGFDPAASREAMVQAALAKMEAERARERMITDIMSDPRLAGFSVGEREQALGIGSAAGGATFAEDWVAGAVSVDAGKGFTDAFGAQLRAQEAQWRVFGSLSAGWMIEGMEGAAGQATNALVNVLFPGIYEELRRAGVVATP